MSPPGGQLQYESYLSVGLGDVVLFHCILANVAQHDVFTCRIALSGFFSQRFQIVKQHHHQFCLTLPSAVSRGPSVST